MTLEEKLKKILEAEWREGHDHCEEDYCEAYPQVEDSVSQIISVFEEEGWEDTTYRVNSVSKGRVGEPLMTGTEWLKKFEREFKTVHIPKVTDDWEFVANAVAAQALDAARRASGVKG